MIDFGMQRRNPMKSAIVGCGSIAHVHAKSILALGHELVALADIDAERLSAFSQEFGGNTYCSLEEMLDAEEVDVLHICTPHNLHVPMAVYALCKGVHVFMEKPPVINFDQLAELHKALDEQSKANSPKKLGFSFQNRYNPSVVKAYEILQSGDAGKVLGARGYVTWNRGAAYYQDPWHGTLEQEGGGVLINQAIHTLDLLHYFVGKTPVNVDAVMANHRLKTEIEVEDTVSALVFYPDARMSFYATNGHTEDCPPLIEIQCENISLRMEGNTLYCKSLEGAWEQIEVEQQSPLGKSYWGAGHIVCIKDFYDSILEKRPFALELPSVEETILLTLKIYQSAKEHRSISWED